eukprot:3958559-Prymnesium_polylepis.1
MSLKDTSSEQGTAPPDSSPNTSEVGESVGRSSSGSDDSGMKPPVAGRWWGAHELTSVVWAVRPHVGRCALEQLHLCGLRCAVRNVPVCGGHIAVGARGGRSHQTNRRRRVARTDPRRSGRPHRRRAAWRAVRGKGACGGAHGGSHSGVHVSAADTGGAAWLMTGRRRERTECRPPVPQR